MSSKKQPQLKPEILLGLNTAFADVARVISELPEGVFTQKPNQKWSVAEQLTHLILSCYAVASALKMPKEAIAKFGKPVARPRSFEKLKDQYYVILAEGMKAPSQFEPLIKEGTTKASMLENWHKIGAKFQERLAGWSEKELDEFSIPHPAMGNLSVREMLFFTIFHNYHHLKAIESLEKTFV